MRKLLGKLPLAITFSLNVYVEDRRKIQNLLELDNAQPHDSYLGLPMVVGQNKYKTFIVIKVYVWKRYKVGGGIFFLQEVEKCLLKQYCRQFQDM